MKIQAKGMYVILDPIKENHSLDGGFIIDSKLDSKNRYLKANVISADDGVGLKEGDTIYYDKQNTFGIRHAGKLYEVCLLQNVIGIFEE